MCKVQLLLRKVKSFVSRWNLGKSILPDITPLYLNKKSESNFTIVNDTT